jgi:hypothetical protein
MVTTTGRAAGIIPPELPYVIAVLENGEWKESFFETGEQARTAWAELPAGVFARYFVEGTLIRQGSGR